MYNKLYYTCIALEIQYILVNIILAIIITIYNTGMVAHLYSRLITNVRTSIKVVPQHQTAGLYGHRSH